MTSPENSGETKVQSSSEIDRNSSLEYDCYLGNRAQQRAGLRAKNSHHHHRLRNEDVRAYVLSPLEIGWSPEQISGKLRNKYPERSVSHEAIYQYIYDKETRKRVNLAVYLPRAHKKRKLFGQGHHHKNKLHIPRRVPIDKRPKYIAKRIQPGHWEADTMISRQSKRALAISLERKSRMIHIDKLTAKKSHKLVKAITSRLNRYPKALCRSITYITARRMRA